MTKREKIRIEVCNEIMEYNAKDETLLLILILVELRLMND